MRTTDFAGRLIRTVLIATLAVSPVGCARTTAPDGAAGPAPGPRTAAEREGPPSWVWLALGAAGMLLLIVATAEIEGPEPDYSP
jgi:hypothetical protein